MKEKSDSSTTEEVYFNGILRKATCKISIEVNLCPACGGTNRKLIRRLPPTLLFLCRDCRLVYISPRLSDELLEVLYLNNPGEQSGGVGSGLKNYMAERYRTMIKEMHPMSGIAKKSLLDIGCGWGHFLKEAEPWFGSVAGVELSSKQAAWAKKKLNLNVSQQNIFEKNSSAQYHLITLWEVIEHLTRPSEVVQWAFDHLTPGGQFILSTPNHNSIFKSMLGAHWFFYIPTQHLSYFTPFSIKTLLANTGFRDIKIVTSGRSLLRERKNCHNMIDTKKCLRDQWVQSLILRNDIEKHRNNVISINGKWRKLKNALIWRILQIIYKAGMGDQMRAYAVK